MARDEAGVARSNRGVCTGQRVEAEWIEAARLARRDGGSSEQLAWELVRGRDVLGLKIRRQQIIDGLRVDLYCAALHSCIEIDGGVHDDPSQAEYDAERTRALEHRGLRVLRIRAIEVSLAALVKLLAPVVAANPNAAARKRRKRAR